MQKVLLELEGFHLLVCFLPNKALNKSIVIADKQINNLLKAIAAGTTLLSSVSAAAEFGLGTSANVKKNKVALEKKEIIDLYSGPPAFLDPAFQLWFERNFMAAKE